MVNTNNIKSIPIFIQGSKIGEVEAPKKLLDYLKNENNQSRVLPQGSFLLPSRR